RTIHRVICIAVIGMLLWLLPSGLLAGGIVWLFGYVAWEAGRRIQLNGFLTRSLFIAASLLGFAGALIWVRIGRGESYGDVAIGGALAIFLVAASQLKVRNALLETFSSRLAAMSYSLYLVHFPAAAFLAALLLRGQRFSPGFEGSMVYAATFAGV